MKSLSDNRGFGAVEIVLMILAILLVVAVGWLVYDHDRASDVATSSLTQNSPQTTATATPQAVSENQVRQLVSTFFNQFLNCYSSGKGDLNQTCTTGLVSKYGTANLYAYYKPATGGYAQNPILCAQDSPNAFSVLGISISSEGASGIVVEDFETGASSVKFTIVNQSNGLKIDSVTCDPPLVPSDQPL